MFEIIVLGVFVIWCLFYGKIKSGAEVFLFIGVISMIVGYFYKDVIIKSLTVDIFICFGVVMICLFLFCYGVNKINFENICLSVICYGIINLFSFEFNSFFGSGLLVCLILLISLFRSGFRIYIQNINLSLILCELFNIFFMMSRMDFAVIFSNEFVRNFVVLNLVAVGMKIIVDMVKRGEYEKGC